MFRLQVRLKSTAQIVQEQLKSNLEAYFEKTAFHFQKPDHVKELRRIMELVYLRNRPLVAIDTEYYEKKPTLITEFGFAIYDPENQWLSANPHIRTVHIISHENKNKLNSTYVPNHKRFFNGEKSHQLNNSQSSKYLKETFKYYFEERNAVLIGHNLIGDLKWLQSFGVGKSGDMPQVDTQRLFQISRKRGATLKGILQAVEIPHAKLHNAANDAYYTLLAALSYCDPERRQHFKMDSYYEQPQVTGKGAKEAMRMQRFIEKAPISLEIPPSVIYEYPKLEVTAESDVVESSEGTEL